MGIIDKRMLAADKTKRFINCVFISSAKVHGTYNALFSKVIQFRYWIVTNPLHRHSL